MTSKEFIEKLKSDGIYYCKECNLKGCDNCEKERNAQFDSVIKDLEVLEMLRPHLINAGIGMFDNVGDNEIFHLKVNLSGKEYKKLEECIRNDAK